MGNLSLFIIPLLVVIIIIYGFIKKVDLYDSFIRGAKEGLSTVITIFPFIISMVFAINIFLKSGFIPYIFSFMEPYLIKLNIPITILPMSILRSISGSATLVIMNDVFTNYGPDSFAGRLASTIQGCSDTTFYVLTLYYGSIGVSKIRHTLKAALFADLMGVIAAFLITYLVFG